MHPVSKSDEALPTAPSDGFVLHGLELQRGSVIGKLTKARGEHGLVRGCFSPSNRMESSVAQKLPEAYVQERKTPKNKPLKPT